MKKNGKVRGCIDLRNLNKKTLFNNYHLPNIVMCMQALKGLSYFCILVFPLWLFAQMLLRFKLVFMRMTRNDLRLQPTKCHSFYEEISYLDHKVSNQGIYPDYSKIKAMLDFSAPQTVRHIKSSLVFVPITEVL